ncbi:MAG: hypothetical protein KAI91_06860, partial [Candidatus Omnitrophica bacterium]|nr:hypothetical protein [Candidatus Omnitrophota bacterium]
INLNKIIQVIKITKKLGISTYGNFILGFPGETKETCEITIAFSKKLNCDISRFGIFVPYPGSQFFKELKTRMKDNIYDYEKYDPQIEHNSRLLYVPEAMTENELINLQRKAILGFYLRPSFILSHLIKRTFRFKDLCYGILGLIIKGYKFFIYILKQKIFNK